MTIVLWAVLLAWLGVGILPYLVLQAVIGFTLLEVINYIEHYGLLRQRVGTAERERYERVEPEHSWNANQIATNVLLYHLQRHSDHHANPTRRYQALRDYPDAPQLPTGYAGMLLLALVPPLWFRVMDPRVIAHYGGDVQRANLSPRRRRVTGAPSLQASASRPPAATPEPVDTRVPMPVDDVTALRCPGCGYRYDPQVGDPREGFPAGTPWSSVPTDWCCPDCGVRDKSEFVPAGGRA
jgi:alkane 1-monooxygenase